MGEKTLRSGDPWRRLRLADAASLDVATVLQRLAVSEAGLTTAEAQRRLALAGPNAIRSHAARTLEILLRQVQNPLLILLVATATTSLVVGQKTDAVIIIAIITLSAGLGFLNEYRAARTVEALHSRLRHMASVVRDGHAAEADVIDLVPGDLVRLEAGDVVPADIRLLEAHEMECDEAVLTGEATPVEKDPRPVAPGGSLLDLSSCVFMGTVVRSGAGRGVVVRTGKDTEFGKIATRLGEAQEETAFQQGLRSFSVLLLQVTIVLTASIFVVNTALSRPLLDSALFSLAIAVGLTPQLLPAIVTVSLSLGSRRLAQKSVIVKRLVSIEDLGNVEVLFTDKTGTLTEGRITFSAALDPAGKPSSDTLLLGRLCSSVIVEDGVLVGGNLLDRALWEVEGSSASVTQFRRLSEVPFDYERRLMSVLVDDTHGHRRIITKGAPESLLTRCRDVPPSALTVMNREFQAGSRVIAVATREAPDLSAISVGDERDLTLVGFITFVDRVKPDAGAAIQRLAGLGVTVKIVTGDNDQVARKVCSDMKMRVRGVLTGNVLEGMSDEEVAAAISKTTIFARVTPEQKSRLIRLQRKQGTDVGFLGDGVNDAIALHDADVGISVDSGTDVAKDAADIVLLEKDLNILADGVVEGRRIFSNTIKYVLMGTSSNFGNMFSAAGGSLVLSFLPMLPTQILLNNLLYDISEMTIPTDNVDEELLRRPAHWDMSFIRRFMLFFGPISSVYDFMTFGVMLWVFRADETLFHTGWFVESLATQALVIFIIRTRRIPFFRSRPSLPLLATTLTCVVIGLMIPLSPLASTLGFKGPPLDFFAILVLMVVTYLGLVELGKSRFFRPQPGAEPLARRKPPRERRIHRRAARWSKPGASGETKATGERPSWRQAG